MDYNNPSEIVKELNFGDEAKNKVIMGVEKLSKAVKSTLGASGKCVIYEDARGNPVITKDGVTVAESVVLFDPVENMGATLVKEAARNTVREAGDGTTTATVLAEALLKEVNKPDYSNISTRDIKDGISSALKKVNKYLDDTAIEVKGSMLDNVASISCNNDVELGKIISEAYTRVGKDGVVFMEESETEETYVDVVEGIQLDNGLTSPHFITNQDKQKAELENPYVLIVSSEIPNVRKIQSILEYVIKKGRALLIVAPVSQQVKSALLMNKVKGNIKVNIIDLPGFGPTKKDTTEDLAIATGATVINEELGDDLDIISVEHLGEVERSITDSKTTVITTSYDEDLLEDRIKSIKELIKNEKNPFIANKQKKRIAMLKGNVGMIYVGADSKVELKEKKDRVEDAIYATKAALQEGIVPGGGVALLNAAQELFGNKNEEILLNAIKSPFHTILNNGGVHVVEGSVDETGFGVNVIDGKRTNMVENGIVDPVLVTKSALKNAVSVVTTIISADCVISNMRGDESNK
jgi:chaperonin GroEL